MSVGTNLPDLVNVESWDGLNKGHIILGGIQVQSPQTNPFLPWKPKNTWIQAQNQWKPPEIKLS